MNRTRLNGMLALVVVALAGLAIWDARRGEPPPPTLAGPAPDAVQAVRIEGRNGTLRLERAEDGSWRVAGDPSLPAASGRVERLLSLARARIERAYPADQAEPGALGLSPPQATVIWEPTGFRIEIGGTDPVEGLRYVRVDDRIALIPGYPAEAALGKPAAFISRRLLPAGAEPIEIRTPKAHLVRKGDGDWRVEGREGLSRDRINAWLDEWRHARAVAVERLEGSIPDGLPEWRVRLADGRTLRFLLEDREGQPTRLLRPDLKLGYEITTYLRDRLAAPPPVEAAGDVEAGGASAVTPVEAR